MIAVFRKLRAAAYVDYSHDSSYTMDMKKVSKSELKAKMFEHLRAVEKTGEDLIVTDYGKPVLTIIPVRPTQTINDLFSDLRGKAEISRAAALEPTDAEWSED